MNRHDSFEEDPPSYDHAFQTNLDPENQVYAFGKLHDASTDSYERGEMFIQAFRSSLDVFPSELARQIGQEGLVRTMRVQTSPLAFNRHPKETRADRPAARAVSDDRLQFWPQTRPDLDLDLTVQGTHPLLALSEYLPRPPPGLSQHYFEMTVEQVGSDPLVLAIGLCTAPYPVFRMPGWNTFSVAYHSDDGHKFCDDATGGQPFGPSWSAGDTVGCGYCPETGTVFFTLNGCRVGPHNAFSALRRHYYYPSFGADGPAQVQFNFGQRPFLYPVENWIGNHV